MHNPGSGLGAGLCARIQVSAVSLAVNMSGGEWRDGYNVETKPPPLPRRDCRKGLCESLALGNSPWVVGLWDCPGHKCKLGFSSGLENLLQESTA